MKAKFKLWIEDEKGNQLLGGGLVKILESIDRLGSINKASKELKMSYRACWGKIKKMEERLGKSIVHTTIGGGKDRGATLTPEAKELLTSFYKFSDSVSAHIESTYKKIFKG